MLENESANARFGRLLREFRNNLGLTQEQLALKAGYDRTFISRVERGLSNLTLYSAETLANALGIPLYKFFIESEEKNMPRATKEFVLNYAMNRWQLNFKKNVGPTSELIRSCAPHNFEVLTTLSDARKDLSTAPYLLQKIHFQEGPVKECGVNGVMNEDLIAMVITRLEHFQKSEFACRENALAITKLEEALLWLRKRTMGREKKGIEGTHKV